MWDYLCPRCQKEVKKNSHECPSCGEKYPLPLRVPPELLKNLNTLEGKKALEKYVHKHVFPRVSAFERNYLTQYFTVLFSDGFESGTILTTDTPAGAWDWVDADGDAISPVIGTSPHSGIYNAICQALNWGTSAIFKVIAATAALYCRSYVKFSVLPPLDTNYMRLLSARYDYFDQAFIIIINDADNLYWGVTVHISKAEDPFYDAYTVKEASPSNILIDHYYCVEVMRDVPNSIAKLWVDGALKATESGHTYTNNSVNCQIMGSARNVPALTVSHDDVVVSDEYIGPESYGAHLQFRSS